MADFRATCIIFVLCICLTVINLVDAQSESSASGSSSSEASTSPLPPPYTTPPPSSLPETTAPITTGTSTEYSKASVTSSGTIARESSRVTSSSTSTETTASSVSITGRPTTGNADCAYQATLGHYCGDFLQDRENSNVLSSSNFTLQTTADDIMGMIINNKIIDALGSQCDRGVWCLDDSFHETIYQGMSSFYNSPICNDAVWVCIESMVVKRQDCPDFGMMSALMEMVNLLCDLHSLGDLQPECFTRTIEILHVLRSDIVREHGAIHQAAETLCDDYLTKIVKTFLCTIDPCGLKQKVFLKEFTPLVDVALNSEMVFVKCNLSTLCPDNTTLAPRLDLSVDGNIDLGMVTSSSSINGSDVDNKIMQEEVAEENALDQVFEELEQQLEHDKASAATNTPSASEDTNAPSSDTNAPSSDTIAPSSDTNAPSADTNAPSSDISGSEGGASEEGHVDDVGGLNESSSAMDPGQTMLFGTITLSTLVLLGLLIMGYMSFRHYRRKKGLVKRGYSQLDEEQSRMLSNYE